MFHMHVHDPHVLATKPIHTSKTQQLLCFGYITGMSLLTYVHVCGRVNPARTYPLKYYSLCVTYCTS